jgi:hypothetical protein
VSIRDLATAATLTGDEVRVAVNVATHAEAVLREVGDDDGARQARLERDRLRHPTVTLVVAGEYQQGKSSLINALLGTRLMPTEPLATTSAPIRVSWARDTSSHALVPGERVEVDLDRLAQLATTERPRLDDRLVVGLEVTLDHPLLRSGVSLVDTPCVSGGLSTQTAGLVLGLLQEAEGLIFVTDASQELTGPELEFLRMAHTLCPSLLVILSKIDLYPEWRRILDIDQSYMAAIDPEATVLPASPQLRGAAVRWADPELDRASGLPLVSWYLGSTLLTTARQVVVARSGAALATRLGATGAFVEEQVAVLERSTGQHRVDEQYRQASARLEMLRLEAPKRVRLELRAFTRATTADLTNRFAGVNDMVADLVRRVDPADQWGEIEATLHRVTNRALAEHLTYVRARAEAVVVELAGLLGLTPEALADQSEVAEAPEIPAGARPDIDDPDFSRVRTPRVHDALRGAVSSGFMGIGVATMVLTGGVAALALGAGASLSTMVLTLRRERTRDLESRRAKALQACRAWITEARSALGTYTEDLNKELEFQLENRIEKQLQSLLEQVDAERARLDALRRVAAERVPEEVTRARAQLERVRLIHAHARRLEHRLARPDLQVAAR